MMSAIALTDDVFLGTLGQPPIVHEALQITESRRPTVLVRFEEFAEHFARLRRQQFEQLGSASDRYHDGSAVPGEVAVGRIGLDVLFKSQYGDKFTILPHISGIIGGGFLPRETSSQADENHDAELPDIVRWHCSGINERL